jgi:5-methyltetrahydropteroyltriglutamate--homocysteine methyltransferase
MKELAQIRNDVVGSLLRPEPLKQARVNYDEGKIGLEELRAIEDQNIRDAVRLQESIGLSVVTDGEYRRLNFQDSFGESVTGFDAGKPTLHFYEKRVEGSSPLRRW